MLEIFYEATNLMIESGLDQFDAFIAAFRFNLEDRHGVIQEADELDD